MKGNKYDMDQTDSDWGEDLWERTDALQLTVRQDSFAKYPEVSYYMPNSSPEGPNYRWQCCMCHCMNSYAADVGCADCNNHWKCAACEIYIGNCLSDDPNDLGTLYKVSTTR